MSVELPNIPKRFIDEMKKHAIYLAAIGLLSLSAPLLAADHTVKMLNNGADGMMVFEPGYLKVSPGDNVTFVPTDPGHNSVSAAIPAGAAAWEGGMGEQITVTLDQAGVYIYKCTPHTMLGMIGVIQVGEASNLAEANAAAESISGSISMNKERLGQYMNQVQ